MKLYDRDYMILTSNEEAEFRKTSEQEELEKKFTELFALQAELTERELELKTAKLLDDEGFANFFLGNRSLGLAVLNSCQGAEVSEQQIFAGIAPNLVRRGIPAVVAMQYPILDSTAKLFADEFYRTLALGYPVDAAIQTTRNAISQDIGLDKRDFATPVLYMRAPDGIILNSYTI
ncbi:CHAT domain-containing protein [Scytonema sp. NUACC26]|uniref:CHAT domain-containing protein n=1 Tax=Scytonema sp. NUACC26 TaxID=3140176 RepID=UPI0034DC4487